MVLTEGDAVLKNKKGVHRGGRGKKDRRKKGRAVRAIIPLIREAGIRQPHRKGYLV